MALQVWLPLSGNISNYGLSDVKPDSSGSIVYGSGLFGDKCFNSGTGAVHFELASAPTEFTLSMWVKPNSPVTNSTLVAFGEDGDHLDMSTDTVTYKWNGGNVVADNSTAFTVNDGEWSHVAITVDGTNVKVFVNGTLTTTLAQSAEFAAKDFYFGQKANGNNSWNGYIQDVKLFTHIVSTRELMNMSLGLVLNYTFNHNGFGNANLLNGSVGVLHVEGTNKVNRVENNKMYATLAVGTYTLSADTTGTWTNTNSDNGANVVSNDNENFPVALELYTLDGNNDVADRYFVDMTGGAGAVSISTTGTYYLGGIVYGNGVTHVEADFYAIKLEQGTKATAWIPPVGSSEYSFFDIGEIEQDTSGNGLDGTPSSTGPLWTDDSRIYTGAYDFSNNSYIESPVIDVTNLGKYTVSVWAKTAAFGNCILFGFNLAPRFNFAVMNGVFGIYDSESGQLVPFGEGESASSYVGVWHHYTITGDGTTNKLYIDGELIGSTSKYFAIGSSKLYINGWDNSISNNYNGLLSDFRIYAIELSAAQIDALCHNRAALDNTGKLYTNEFIASSDAFSISRNGVISGTDFTVFNTPITPASTATSDVSRFSVSESKVAAVDMIEV